MENNNFCKCRFKGLEQDDFERTAKSFVIHKCGLQMHCSEKCTAPANVVVWDDNLPKCEVHQVGVPFRTG
jgi:hypothetical protein